MCLLSQSIANFVLLEPILLAPTSLQVFGLHENADITKDLQDTNMLLDSLMLTQSRQATGVGMSFEEAVGGVATDILDRMPPPFDLEEVERIFPQEYLNSMNTVLVQVSCG